MYFAQSVQLFLPNCQESTVYGVLCHERLEHIGTYKHVHSEERLVAEPMAWNHKCYTAEQWTYGYCMVQFQSRGYDNNQIII